MSTRYIVKDGATGDEYFIFITPKTTKGNKRLEITAAPIRRNLDTGKPIPKVSADGGWYSTGQKVVIRIRDGRMVI